MSNKKSGNAPRDIVRGEQWFRVEGDGTVWVTLGGPKEEPEAEGMAWFHISFIPDMIAGLTAVANQHRVPVPRKQKRTP